MSVKVEASGAPLLFLQRKRKQRLALSLCSYDRILYKITACNCAAVCYDSGVSLEVLESLKAALTPKGVQVGLLSQPHPRREGAFLED